MCMFVCVCESVSCRFEAESVDWDVCVSRRFEAESVDWDVGAVFSMSRGAFGPKGPLELGSERLILQAGQGDPQAVYRILRDGRIHPDVGDAQGHTPLIAATVTQC